MEVVIVILIVLCSLLFMVFLGGTLIVVWCGDNESDENKEKDEAQDKLSKHINKQAHGMGES